MLVLGQANLASISPCQPLVTQTLIRARLQTRMTQNNNLSMTKVLGIILFKFPKYTIWDLKAVSVNASIKTKGYDLYTETNLWWFQLISLCTFSR